MPRNANPRTRARTQTAIRARRATLAAATLLLGATAALAGPVGESVQHGQATFQRDGTHTLIDVTTPKAIINYDSFNLTRDESVRFQQLSASSRVLNRIQGAAPTIIDGSVYANGQVYFVNPAGVMFGQNAVIDTAGIYAAAGSITNADFLNNVDRFTNLTGDVVNQGTINSQFVALVGQRVRNDGIIFSRDGLVTMVAGDNVTLARHNDTVSVTFTRSADTADDNSDIAAVTNNGQIDTGENGKATLAAGDMYWLGVKQSQTGAVRGEQIAVNAEGGRAEIDGTLDASSDTGDGGAITVTADEIAMYSAYVDASGATGGGQINIGGALQGGPSLYAADTTVLGAGVNLHADATGAGDGGNVIVWADGSTEFRGAISARGGPGGGDGGFVEVSGHDHLTFAGQVSTLAPLGQTGVLLLDPLNLNIIDGAAGAEPNGGTVGSGTSGDPYAADGDTSVVHDATINAALAGSNVFVSTDVAGGEAGDLTVDAAADINWASGFDLTLIGNNSITVDGTIQNTTAAGGLTLDSPTITLNGTIDLSGGGALQNGALATTAVNVQSGWTGTLQQAIDLADNNATVEVEDGMSFNEDLVIQNRTGLSLVSDNSGVDPVITPPGQIRIEGTAGNFKLGGDNPGEGFTINSSGNPAANLVALANGPGGVTIQNNAFDTSANDANQAISMGVVAVDGLSVLNNTFTLGNSDGAVAQINQGTDTTNLTVQGNTVQNAGGETGSYALQVMGVTTANIENNAIDGLSRGIVLNSGQGTGVTGVTIADNTITNATNEGVWLRADGASNVQNVTIENNFITSNGEGIQIDADGGGATFDLTNVLVNNNDLSGNTTAINNLNADALDAEFNWFGSADVTTINGLVSGTVDVSPFLASGTDADGGTAGFQPDLAALGTDGTDDADIQTALDNVANNGTITVTDTGTMNQALDFNGVGTVDLVFNQSAGSATLDIAANIADSAGNDDVLNLTLNGNDNNLVVSNPVDLVTGDFLATGSGSFTADNTIDAGSIDIQNTGAANFNADLTADTGNIVADDASGLDIGGNNVQIVATNGLVNLDPGAVNLNLSGTGNNVVTAGAGGVSMPNLTASSPTLMTINSATGYDAGTINIGTTNLAINIDTDDNGAETLTIGLISAVGTFDVTGTSANETLDLQAQNSFAGATTTATTGTATVDTHAIGYDNFNLINVNDPAGSDMTAQISGSGTANRFTLEADGDILVDVDNNAADDVTFDFTNRAAGLTIDGLGGSDELVGPSGATFNVTAANAGNVAGENFQSVENLTGAGGSETFNIDAAITSINALGGDDNVIITDLGAVGSLSVTTGGGANDQVTVDDSGRGGDTDYTVTEATVNDGTNALTLNDAPEALTLTSGGGDNQITVTPSNTTAFTINGGGQTAGDTLVYDDAALASNALLTLDGANAGTVSTQAPDTQLDVDYTQIELISATTGTFDVDLTIPDGGDRAVNIVRGGGNLQISGDIAINLAEASLDLATGPTVTGGTGNDTLTLDFGGGLFGATFDGNAGNNALALTGDPGGLNTVTHNPTNASDGNVDLDGTVVNYTGLAPIFDATVAANLVVNLTGGADDASILNGPAANAVFAGATNTGLVQDNGATFEDYEYANKDTVTVNALGGADTLTLNQPNQPDSQTDLNITGGADADDITLTAANAAVTNSFDGEGGTNTLTGSANFDNFTVNAADAGSVDDGSGGPAVAFSNVADLTGTGADDTFTFTANLSGTADGVGGDDTFNVTNLANTGSLTLAGGADTTADALNVDDSARGAGVTYTVNDTTVNDGVGNVLTLAGIENIDLLGTAAADTVNLTPSATTGFNLDGGLGADVLVVDGSLAGANEIAIEDNNVVGVLPDGDSDNRIASSAFNNVLFGGFDQLTLNTGGAANEVRVGEVDTNGDVVRTIDLDEVAPGDSPLQALVLNGGGDSDRFEFEVIPTNLAVTANGGAGNDLFLVSKTVGGADAVLADDIRLIRIQGALTLNGDAQADLVTGDRVEIADESTSATQTGSIFFDRITGLTPQQIDYNGIETMYIELGGATADKTVNINDTGVVTELVVSTAGTPAGALVPAVTDDGATADIVNVDFDTLDDNAAALVFLGNGDDTINFDGTGDPAEVFAFDAPASGGDNLLRRNPADPDESVEFGGADTIVLDTLAGDDTVNINSAITAGDAGAGVLRILAIGGSLADNNATNPDITAADLSLHLADGFEAGGTDGGDLETAVSNLDLRNTNSGDVTIVNTGALVIDDLPGIAGTRGNTGGGTTSITASSPLTVATNVTYNGTTTLTATDDGGGDDLLNIGVAGTPGVTVTLDGAALTFTGIGPDGVAFVNGGNIDATGTHTVDLNTANGDITQDGAFTAIAADNIDLDAATGIGTNANNLTLAGATAGAQSIDADNAGAGDIFIDNAATGSVTVNSLTTAAGSATVSFDQTGGQPVVFSLVNSADAPTTTLTNDNGALTVTDLDNTAAAGTVTIQTTTAGLVTLDTVDVTNLVILDSAGGAAQTAADGTDHLIASELLVRGTGNFNLNDADNDVDTYAVDNVTGSATFVDTDDLTIGTVSGVNGITTSVDGVVNAGGQVDVNQPINTGGIATVATTSGDVNVDTPADPAITATGRATVSTDNGNVVVDNTITGAGVDLTAAQGNLAVNAAVAGGAQTMTFTSQTIDIAANVTGSNTITLQPDDDADGIGIAGGAGTFSLTQTEIDFLQDGFSGVLIGRPVTGAHDIRVQDVTFIDPVTIQTPAGGAIEIAGVITGNDNASVTVDGPDATTTFTTVDPGIDTEGNDITISDAVVVDDGVTATLDTTINGNDDGANVTITGNINGTAADPPEETLVIDAGTTGTSDIQGTVGTIDDVLLLITANTLNIPAGDYGDTSPVFTADNVLFPGDIIAGGNQTDPALIQGDDTVIGTATITIQPQTTSRNINIEGTLVPALSITQADLNDLADGWGTTPSDPDGAGIVIGRANGNGNMELLTDATNLAPLNQLNFRDPTKFRMPAVGGTIRVGNDTTATLGVPATVFGSDNGFLFFDGPGATTTVNLDIITAGNPIIFSDAVVFADKDATPATNDQYLLDTTNGGAVVTGADIDFRGNVNGTQAILQDLTLRAGDDGNIDVAGNVGNNIKLGDVLIDQGGSTFGAETVDVVGTFNAESFVHQFGEGLVRFQSTVNTVGVADTPGGNVTIDTDGQVIITGNLTAGGGSASAAGQGGGLVDIEGDTVSVAGIDTGGSDGGGGNNDGGDAGTITLDATNGAGPQILLRGSLLAVGGAASGAGNDGFGADILVGDGTDAIQVGNIPAITIDTGDTPVDEGVPDPTANIRFDGTFDGAAKDVTFAAPAGSTTTGGDSDITFTGAVSNIDDLVVSSGYDVAFQDTVDGINTATLTYDNDLNFASTVDNVGTLSATGATATFVGVVGGALPGVGNSGAFTFDLTGDLDFQSTVNLTGQLQVVDADNVTAQADLRAGSINQLDGDATTDFQGTVETLNVAGLVISTDTIRFRDTVTVNAGGPFTLTSVNAITFDADNLDDGADVTVAGGAVTLNNGGQLTIGNETDFNLTGASSLTQSGGAVDLGGNVTTAGGFVDFGSAVSLINAANDTVNVTTGAGGGNIDFGDAIVGNNDSLFLTAGVGDISVTGDAGTFNALVIPSARNVDFGGTVTADSFSQLAGTGTTTFGDGAGADDVNITTTMTFGTDDASTTFNNFVAASNTPVTVGNGLTFFSANDITYNNTLTVNAGNAVFGDDVDGADPAQSIRDATFGDAVDVVAGSMLFHDARDVDFDAALDVNVDLTFGNATDTTAVNDVTFDGAVTVDTGDMTFHEANDITAASTIDVLDGSLTFGNVGNATAVRDVNFGGLVTVADAGSDDNAPHSVTFVSARDITSTAAPDSFNIPEGRLVITSADDVAIAGTTTAISVEQTAGTGNTTFTGDMTVNEGRNDGLVEDGDGDDLAFEINTDGTLTLGGALASNDSGNTAGGGDIFINVGDVAFNGGADSITADLANGAVPVSNADNVAILTIQPNTVDGDMTVGAGGTGGVQMSNADVDAIAEGFNHIFLGRADGTGTIGLNNGVTFTDPLFVRSPDAGGDIVIGGGNGSGVIGNDNATLAFDAPDITLGTQIDTEGNAVYFVSESSGNIADPGAGLGGATLADVEISDASDIDTTNGGNPAGADVVFEDQIEGDGGLDDLTINAGTAGNVLVGVDDAGPAFTDLAGPGTIGATLRIGALTITNADNFIVAGDARVTSFTQTDTQTLTHFRGGLDATGPVTITDATEMLFEGTVVAASFDQLAGSGNTTFNGADTFDLNQFDANYSNAVPTSLRTGGFANTDGGDIDINIAGDLLVENAIISTGGEATVLNTPGNGGGAVNLSANTLDIALVHAGGSAANLSGNGGDGGAITLDATNAVAALDLSGDLIAAGGVQAGGNTDGDAGDVTLGDTGSNDAVVTLDPDAAGDAGEFSAVADTLLIAGNDAAFNGTVDAAAAGADSLFVVTFDDGGQLVPGPQGTTTFNGLVGSNAALQRLRTDNTNDPNGLAGGPVNGLTVEPNGSTVINVDTSAIVADPTIEVTSEMTFNDAVVIDEGGAGAAVRVELEATDADSTVRFNNTLDADGDFAHNLEIDSFDTIFDDNGAAGLGFQDLAPDSIDAIVGGTNPLNILSVDDTNLSGTTTINTTALTGGAFEFHDAVLIATDQPGAANPSRTTITATGNNPALPIDGGNFTVLFDNTVDSQDDAVAADDTGEFNELFVTTTNIGTTRFNGRVGVGSGVGVFDNALGRLQTDTLATADGVTQFNITTGAATDADVQTSGASVELNDPVQLFADTVIVENDPAGTVHFNNTVDGTVADTQNLTVTTNGGRTRFGNELGDVVGGNFPLNTLRVDHQTTNPNGDVTEVNADLYAVDMDFQDSVEIGDNVTFGGSNAPTDANSIVFAGLLDSVTGETNNLTLDATTTQFEDNVGSNEPLGTVTTTLGGVADTTILGDNTDAEEDLTFEANQFVFEDDVQLQDNATVTGNQVGAGDDSEVAGNIAIDFQEDLNSDATPRDLTLITTNAGLTRIGDANDDQVGNTGAIGVLTVDLYDLGTPADSGDGVTLINSGNLTVETEATFNDPVAIGTTPVTLTANDAANGTIRFNNTLDSQSTETNDLTLDAAFVIFDDDGGAGTGVQDGDTDLNDGLDAIVGGTDRLATLTVGGIAGAGQTFVNTTGVNVDVADFNDPVIIATSDDTTAGDPGLVTVDGLTSITFDNTVDSSDNEANNLTLVSPITNVNDQIGNANANSAIGTLIVTDSSGGAFTDLTTLATDVITVIDLAEFNDPTVVDPGAPGSLLTITATDPAGTINFTNTGTLNSSVGEAQNLTLVATNTIFSGEAGTGPTGAEALGSNAGGFELGTVITTDGGNGDVTTLNNLILEADNWQFDDAVRVDDGGAGAPATITLVGYNTVVFNNTLDSTFDELNNLTIDSQDTTFGDAFADAVGETTDADGDATDPDGLIGTLLVQDDFSGAGTGIARLVTDTVTAVDVDFDVPVELRGEADGPNLNQMITVHGFTSVNFEFAVDSQATEGNSLTVNTAGDPRDNAVLGTDGPGTTRFSGDIGTAANGRLGQLITDADGTTFLNGGTNGAAATGVANTGLNLASPVDGFQFNDDVILETPMAIDSAGADTLFNARLDSEGGEENALTLDAGATGDITFVGRVGDRDNDDDAPNNTRLGAVQIDNANDVVARALFKAASLAQGDNATNTSGGTGDTQFDALVDTSGAGGNGGDVMILTDGEVRLYGGATLDGDAGFDGGTMVLRADVDNYDAVAMTTNLVVGLGGGANNAPEDIIVLAGNFTALGTGGGNDGTILLNADGADSSLLGRDGVPVVATIRGAFIGETPAGAAGPVATSDVTLNAGKVAIGPNEKVTTFADLTLTGTGTFPGNTDAPVIHNDLSVLGDLDVNGNEVRYRLRAASPVLDNLGILSIDTGVDVVLGGLASYDVTPLALGGTAGPPLIFANPGAVFTEPGPLDGFVQRDIVNLTPQQLRLIPNPAVALDASTNGPSNANAAEALAAVAPKPEQSQQTLETTIVGEFQRQLLADFAGVDLTALSPSQRLEFLAGRQLYNDLGPGVGAAKVSVARALLTENRLLYEPVSNMLDFYQRLFLERVIDPQTGQPTYISRHIEHRRDIADAYAAYQQQVGDFNAEQFVQFARTSEQHNDAYLSLRGLRTLEAKFRMLGLTPLEVAQAMRSVVQRVTPDGMTVDQTLSAIDQVEPMSDRELAPAAEGEVEGAAEPEAQTGEEAEEGDMPE